MMKYGKMKDECIHVTTRIFGGIPGVDATCNMLDQRDICIRLYASESWNG